MLATIVCEQWYVKSQSIWPYRIIVRGKTARMCVFLNTSLLWIVLCNEAQKYIYSE